MAIEIPDINFFYAAPVIVTLVTAMLLMFIDLFAPQFVKKWAAWIALIGLGVALFFTINAWFYPGATFTPQGGTP
ncbi:MAG: hypothetical protein P8169_03475, partial [Chloroflexota bacterium]